MADADEDETGKRIRLWRIERGLRQADLAKSVGISPSYLNLIEHNRRRIAGKLLADIAKVLRVDAGQLGSGAPYEILEAMQKAAAAHDVGSEVDAAQDMAARYPAWAGLIASQSQRIAALEVEITTLRNRIVHDPVFAETLHEVLSSVTSIRSAASILVGDDKLDADWQRRFHANIHSDAVKLAENSDNLLKQLEAPGSDRPSGSPMEIVSAWLMDRDFHLLELEEGKPVDQFVAAAGLPEEANEALYAFASQYVADAAQMPLSVFLAAGKESGWDPYALSKKFAAGLDAVLRRLTNIPIRDGTPNFGLVTCDGAGVVRLVKEVHEFKLDRSGRGCPHWPLFKALSQPGRVVHTDLQDPFLNGEQIQCYALASYVTGAIGVAPSMRSIMVVTSGTTARVPEI